MIFWPGGSCSPKLSQAIQMTGVNRHLFSFFYEAKKRFNDGDDDFHLVEGFDLFVDSGAFSAWSRGIEVDIEEYIAFVKYHRGSIEHCINLDTISMGSDPWSLDKAAEASWKNFQYLRECDVPALPVFHYGEDMKWLKLFCRECDYICLGGMVGITAADRTRWLDTAFRVAQETRPDIKIHGLGIGDLSLIERMPWYSVDSTTWLRIASMGSMLVPQKRDGQFVFDSNPFKVYETDIHKVPHIEEWVDYCGTTVLQCAEDYFGRFLVMLTYFREICEKPHVSKPISKHPFF